MMRAMVVYESMFGNTEEVALAIAAGLQSGFDVDVVNVDAAPATVPADVDLLVVGAPTHMLGLSRERSRTDAAAQIAGPTVTQLTSLRDWLPGAIRGRGKTAAAAFATRSNKALWLPGSAAHSTAKLLRRSGSTMVTKPADFYVVDTRGPLAPGEAERATKWGAGVVADLAPGTTVGGAD